MAVLSLFPLGGVFPEDAASFLGLVLNKSRSNNLKAL